MLARLLKSVEESSVTLGFEGIQGIANLKRSPHPTPFTIYFETAKGELSPTVDALVKECFGDLSKADRSTLMELISKLSSIKGDISFSHRIEWRPRE
jgi:hypothetical protein